MDLFQNLFSIEPVSDPSAAVRDGEVEIPSPFAPNVGSKDSQTAYKSSADTLLRNVVNATLNFGKLWQSGQRFFRIVSNESQNGILSKIQPMLSGAKVNTFGATGAIVPNVGFTLSELSMAGPILAASGMLLLIIAKLQGIHNSIEALSDEMFMGNVRHLDGARDTAQNALLASKDGYTGFQDSAYVNLKNQYFSFCKIMNDKILSTNPEDENTFLSVFRPANKWVKICETMQCGIISLVDTITVSSDLCCRINPIVAYNDRVADLKALNQVNLARLAEILHYVDAEKFADFESYVTRLPNTLTDLIKAQDKKPVLIVSRENLTQQKDNAHV